jgi:hypothetical protein
MEARFTAKIDKNGANGCWNWIGAMTADGYGRFSISPKIENAHRVAYRLWVGDIPNDLVVRHKCLKNRKCVNPEHLEVGTKLENAMDKKRDGTERVGEDKPQSKLTEVIINQIRDEYSAGNETHRSLASKYNVCSSTIHNILHKIKWKHI